LVFLSGRSNLHLNWLDLVHPSVTAAGPWVGAESQLFSGVQVKVVGDTYSPNHPIR